MRYTAITRYGNQELDVREFVLPKGVMVANALEPIQAAEVELDRLIWRCWDWVCREIEYPPYPLATADYHREEAFLRGSSAPWVGYMPIKRSTRLEFWQFPFETIDHGLGDCEDTTFLLCSILRAIPLPVDEIHVAVGRYLQYGHAWVSLLKGTNRYILETTLSQAFSDSPYQVLESYPYQPLLYFNDEQAFEAYGGLGELNKVLRDEETKLRLIEEAYRIVNAKIPA